MKLSNAQIKRVTMKLAGRNTFRWSGSRNVRACSRQSYVIKACCRTEADLAPGGWRKSWRLAQCPAGWEHHCPATSLRSSWEGRSSHARGRMIEAPWPSLHCSSSWPWAWTIQTERTMMELEHQVVGRRGTSRPEWKKRTDVVLHMLHSHNYASHRWWK